MTARSPAVLLVLSFVFSGCSCGDDEAPARDADVIEYELFPSTRVLGDSELSSLDASGDTGVLTFSSEPPALADVAVGQVLLAPSSPKTPTGLLRVVLGVERGGPNALVLRTAAAPLQLAFRKLHVRMGRTADMTAPETTFLPAGIRTTPTVAPAFKIASGRGEESRTYQVVVFDGDGDVATRNDQIELDATLGGGFDYRLETDVDWGIVEELPGVVTDCLASLGNLLEGEAPSCDLDDLLPEAKTSFHVDPFVNLDVSARGAASLSFEEEIFVGTVVLPYVPLGPLVFEPTVDVLAKVEGGASARFEVGAAASAQLESSVTMSTKSLGQPQYSPPRLKDWDVTPREPTVDLNARIEAKVGARLTLAVFGVAGPYATAGGVAELSAAPLSNPCFALRFALEAELGARIKTPSLPIVGSIELLDFKSEPFRPLDEEVATGSCLVPPDPPLPPGAGPTPSVFANPTFTPWAKKLGGSVDGLPSKTGTFLSGSPELVPGIDGRWLSAGWTAWGLHKIDGDGTLTWTSSLAPPDGVVLRALRSVPAGDTGLLVLVQPPGVEAFVLAKLDQAGAVKWSRAYSLPGECANPSPRHLMRDTARGFLVLGGCGGSGAGWMVQVDERGDVVRAQTLHEQGSRVEPLAGVTSEGELVIGGEVARAGELEQTFVTRLDGEIRPTVSTALVCPAQLLMQPTTMIPAEGGGVTVVGTANGLGFVARVRKDGTLGFARFPNLGTGVASSFVVSAVAELPSTGMVIAGSTRNVSQSAPPSVILAGLDSGGSTLWSRRYAVPMRELAMPALQLTDDGGILVTAIAGPVEGRDGDLYAMKVHAKDGNLGGSSEVVESAVTLEDYVCSTATRNFAPVVQALAVTVSPVELERR